MTLDEYTGAGDEGTSCYWIEYGTDVIGRIEGKPSNKFMIWKKGCGSNENNNSRFSFDEMFSVLAKEFTEIFISPYDFSGLVLSVY